MWESLVVIGTDPGGPLLDVDYAVVMNQPTQTRIVIAERQTVVRSALRRFLGQQPGLYVVGEAAEDQELLAQLEVACPDLVLLDWDLPGRPVADLIPALRRPDCQPAVIVLAVRPEPAQSALDAGAEAFVYKGESPKRLLTTIRGVMLERGHG
jgi:DNA-binding NarL/FixJ family response regulator